MGVLPLSFHFNRSKKASGHRIPCFLPDFLSENGSKNKVAIWLQIATCTKVAVKVAFFLIHDFIFKIPV
jgi:hypothetical protein